MRIRIALMLVGALLFGRVYATEYNNSADTLFVTAQVDESGSVMLYWQDPGIDNAALALQGKVGTMRVFRRAVGDPLADFEQVGEVAVDVTAWIDDTTEAGKRYEYVVKAQTDYLNPEQYAEWYPYNIFAATLKTGIAAVATGAPLVENRGRVLLVVEKSLAANLSIELERFEADLAGDGWTFARIEVLSTALPPAVRTAIQAEYYKDPVNTKKVILIGSVAQPYSGWLSPDGHGQRVLPGDLYYGDMDGVWTDNLTFSSGFSDPWGADVSNKAGDGRFDQNFVPDDGDGSPLEMMVARIDLKNMTSFELNGEQLAARYFEKNHLFRHGLNKIEQRSMIEANFNFGDQKTWYSFSAMFGPDKIETNPGNSAWNNKVSLKNLPHAWFYGSGAGNATGAGGVGSTADFAASERKVAFVSLYGSYFHRYTYKNCFLRAPLCMPNYGLTSIWNFGYFHGMATGSTVGEGALIDLDGFEELMKRAEKPEQQAALTAIPMPTPKPMPFKILLGDPTLRLHVVAPVANPSASNTNGKVNLTWEPSVDPDVLGYNVYRIRAAEFGTAVFEKINAALVVDPSYIDAAPIYDEEATYMVRAVKLETTGYYNASQGVFVSITATQIVNTAPVVSAGKNTSARVKQGFSLSGTAFDDGLPNPPATLTYNWQAVKLAGLVQIYGGNTLTPKVICHAPGVYVFRLTVSDGELTSSSDVTVTVK